MNLTLKKTGAILLSFSIVFSGMASGGIAATEISGTNTSTGTKEEKPAVTSADLADKAKLTEEDAKKRILDLFKLPDNAEVNGSSLTEYNNGSSTKIVWQLNWQVKEENRSYGFSTEVDAVTGDIIGYYNYQFDPYKSAAFPPKVSKEDALKIANDLIPVASPSVKGDYRKGQDQWSEESRLFGPVRYSFFFERVVNDIPFPAHSIYITVDGEGEIMNYRTNWSEVEFEAKDNVITDQEAQALYDANLSVGLEYMRDYRKGPDAPLKLVYTPRGISSSGMISATTGKFINQMGEELTEASTPTLQPLQNGSTELAKPKELAKELTSDEAEALIKKYFALSDDYKLEYKSLDRQKDQNGEIRQVWSLRWVKKEGEYGSIWARVDAKNGLILNIENQDQYRYYDGNQEIKEEDIKFSNEQAEQIAVDFVKIIAPEALDSLARFNTNEARVYYNKFPVPIAQINFRQIHKGVPVEYNGIWMTVDLTNGKIINYNNNLFYELGKLPKIDNVIANQDAKAAYLEQYKVSLGYQMLISKEAMEQGRSVETKAILVYTPYMNNDYGYNRGFLDAITGEWFVPYGPKELEEKKATDIDKHWAKDALETLVKFNVIEPDEEGKVNPNKVITSAEWLQMMMRAAYGARYEEQGYYYDGEEKSVFDDVSVDSEHYKLYRMALQYGWIDKDMKKASPDQTLTRDGMASSIVKILQYDKLSKYDKMFNLNFKDANQVENKGAAAIVYGLGIINGKGDNFAPKDGITRAEAATIMMRLVELQGKLDQTIPGRNYYW